MKKWCSGCFCEKRDWAKTGEWISSRTSKENMQFITPVIKNFRRVGKKLDGKTSSTQALYERTSDVSKQTFLWSVPACKVASWETSCQHLVGIISFPEPTGKWLLLIWVRDFDSLWKLVEGQWGLPQKHAVLPSTCAMLSPRRNRTRW